MSSIRELLMAYLRVVDFRVGICGWFSGLSQTRVDEAAAHKEHCHERPDPSRHVDGAHCGPESSHPQRPWPGEIINLVIPHPGGSQAARNIRRWPQNAVSSP